MALSSEIVRRHRLTAAQRKAMYELHGRYFTGLREDKFHRDLDEKDWVILLRDGDTIHGFSTLQILTLNIDGTDHVFLFSGDTIVDRTHWRESHLAGSFGHMMLSLLRDYPDTPCHWFLISKGYRTYRFLPVFFKNFIPRGDQDELADQARLLEAIARHKFGNAYHAPRGLVCANGATDRLRPEQCGIEPGRLADPHVRFFLNRNPGFCDGDELACLAEISRENLNARAWRVIERTEVRWRE